MLSQSLSVRAVRGIGEAVAEKLEKLNIRTVGDLLHWYPRDYLDASSPLPISRVIYGKLVAIQARVVSVKERPTKNRKLKMVDVLVEDETGSLSLRWFNQGFLKQKLTIGSEWVFIGVVANFRGEKVMTSPFIEESPRILAIYSQTKGVTSKMLRGYIDWCLQSVDLAEGDLPDAIKKSEKLQSAEFVMKAIHQPTVLDQVEVAKNQLAFEEVFWFFVRMAGVRASQTDDSGIAISTDTGWLKQIVDSLPFELTHGQKRAVWDSLQDMAMKKPMTRLLNGDVGSGKTIVSALIAAAVAKSGYRSVILAPTEILANQHAESIKKLLLSHNVRIGLYTAAHKDEIGEAQILVGTHALLQEAVAIPNLAFVTVDEQHRFGVRQRQFLREGTKHIPHVLSMTATPIPRTLALALYGDLAISILPEKPKNRLPIITKLVQKNERAGMYERIQTEVDAGRQVFVICPLIEEKPKENAEEESLFTVLFPEEKAATERKTVMAEAERLRKEFPSFGKIETIHGKLKANEKDRIMGRMAAGEISVLVATSVVEVGVDIPNATVMVIEGAERFGLAQLHQFRGRVGRGAFQSYCFLCPELKSSSVEQRLAAVVATDNGFELAQADLDLRGPGELVGQAQSGLPDFKMASLTDLELLQRVKLLVDDYNVTHPEFIRDYSKQAFAHETSSLE